ncbi:MAG: RDD family protein [Luteolibacter sp.]
MEVWIIRDGEKAGPFQDFEIRRKIGQGELDGQTPAWHEGMEEWKRLEEIPLFRSEFETGTSEPEIPEMPEVRFPPPPPPGKPVYGRRFFARWFDLHLYSGVWWLILWASGRNIGDAWANPLLMMVQFIPWFVIETILLHYFGTTPGKWLLGLRVENADGSRLSLAAARTRSIRVFLVGIGMGVNVFSLICQGVSWMVARRFGNALWDFAGGHRVVSRTLGPLRILVFAGLFYIALQLQMLVLSPYVVEQLIQQRPELKEVFDRQMPWHLPKR